MSKSLKSQSSIKAILLAVSSLITFSTQPAQAYCNLPTYADPTGILCQAQKAMENAAIVRDQAQINERQSYLQRLYNSCQVGHSRACKVYNHEMGRQLRHIDNVLTQQRLFNQQLLNH